MKVFKLCKTVALSFTFVGLMARLESASKCAATSLFAHTLPHVATAKQTTTQTNRILFNCIQRTGVNIDSDQVLVLVLITLKYSWFLVFYLPIGGSVRVC